MPQISLTESRPLVGMYFSHFNDTFSNFVVMRMIMETHKMLAGKAYIWRGEGLIGNITNCLKMSWEETPQDSDEQYIVRKPF